MDLPTVIRTSLNMAVARDIPVVLEEDETKAVVPEAIALVVEEVVEVTLQGTLAILVVGTTHPIKGLTAV